MRNNLLAKVQCCSVGEMVIVESNGILLLGLWHFSDIYPHAVAQKSLSSTGILKYFTQVSSVTGQNQTWFFNLLTATCSNSEHVTVSWVVGPAQCSRRWWGSVSLGDWSKSQALVMGPWCLHNICTTVITVQCVRVVTLPSWRYN